jgi:uncharacterized membrane protein
MPRPQAAAYDEEAEAAPPLTRMAITVLSLVGIFLAGYLTLYKLGVIGTLTCQVGSCDRVQGSPWAYVFGIPVAAYGLVGYAAIFAVSLMGVQPRWAGERWVALAIFGMSAFGTAFSGYLTYLEAFVIDAWCMWCVISAVLMTVIFLLSIPGLRRAR